MRHSLALVVALLALVAIPACGGRSPELPDAGIIILVDASGVPDGATFDVSGQVDAPTPMVDARPAPDAPPGACGSTSIAEGVTVSSSTTGLANMTSGSCGGASAGETIYYFDLTSPGDLIVTTDLPGTD